MKVSVDQHKCVSSGQCVVTAPDIFDQREEDGVVQLITANPADQHAEAVCQAEALCPAEAITIHD